MKSLYIGGIIVVSFTSYSTVLLEGLLVAPPLPVFPPPKDPDLDFLLEDETSDKKITTLNDAVINRVGYLIGQGYLDCKSVEIRIFDNGNLKSKAGYDEEGYLDSHWVLGLYNPPEKEKK